jgi:hypothetical protein
VRGICEGWARRDRVSPRRYIFAANVHGLKPLFLGLSLVLIALGMGYFGAGALGIARHEPRAAVLAGTGAGAALVGMVLWRLVRQMTKE